ncbi:MAG: GNAT family N-acetyltransferase [Cytophagaceae bacterium]|nr:GNAT family N-acetyltransferase [Cytophagaceae bacterium]MDW8456984.1 GNAT family N-acetyltransferase [Cytophagaceae bacterium]
MIRYLSHNEIDKAKWDSCVERSPVGLPYAYSWYLDIVAPGWSALIKNDYDAMMPLCTGRKFFISYVYPPYFAQQLGLIQPDHHDPQLCNDFLNEAAKKFSYIEMKVNYLDYPYNSRYKIIENTNYILPLSENYDALKKRYSRGIRNNINQMDKCLKIRDITHAEDIINLFRHNRGNRYKNLGNADYERMKKLLHTVCLRLRGIMWGAFADNRLCAAVFFTEYKNRYIMNLSAVNEEGKKYRAMTLLIDTFIKNKSGSHSILDFEGSNDPLVGRFYKGFGSQCSNYKTVIINRLPPMLKWIKNN